MQQDLLQPPLSAVPDIAPATASLSHENVTGKSGAARAHFVTEGERKFDKLTYTTIGYVINALASVGAVFWVERTHSGQNSMNRFVEWTKKQLPSVNPERAKMLATKTFFLSGGFAVLMPMKMLEDRKSQLIEKWNKEIYGEAAATDPAIQQSQQELKAAPTQGWASIGSSRILALIPFYITTGLLWDRMSGLSRATNQELRALGTEGAKALEKSDPAKFSQIAGKGLYFDRPIAAVSRAAGKVWAKVAGDSAALAKLEEMETKYPGTIRSAKTATGDHDPHHSALPYYFVSEAITSGMVAWGVYALSRVLAPIMGKKHEGPLAPAPSSPSAMHHTREPATSRLMYEVASRSEFGKQLMQDITAQGIDVVPFQPRRGEENLGGHYDEDAHTIFINQQRPLAHQATVLLHEAQHAMNAINGLVERKEAVAQRGEEAYVQNFLRSESLSHAAAFIYSHQANDTAELQSHVNQTLFKDVVFKGADAAALTRYADAAMKPLLEGKLGYLDKAKESYAAHVSKHTASATPDTVIAADTIAHERAAQADLTAAR